MCRYGHNFALQIKQALMERNLTTEFNSSNINKLRYHNCTDHPLRLVFNLPIRSANKPRMGYIKYLSVQIEHLLHNLDYSQMRNLILNTFFQNEAGLF
jgi:hypothetical protein